MKLHIIVHESFESPAAIALWAESRKHQVQYTRVYLEQKLPEDSSDFDFLVVMGGPQSPTTTIEECSHFDAQKEIKLIKEAVQDGKSVLGVCLGAQLIGEALGAKFEHSPNKEIGVFELTLTKAGIADPALAGFPEKFLVGHWHGDMPGLTEKSQILAYSQGCPRQIVKYAANVYGFQCHFEFNSEAIEAMTSSCSDELEKCKNLPYVQDAIRLKQADFTQMNAYLYRFLDYIAAETKA